jgi:hypothetical protein
LTAGVDITIRNDKGEMALELALAKIGVGRTVDF